MKLDVPLIYQPKDSVDCGIAGIAMIMNYFGDNISFEEIKKNISVDSVGTYAPQLGLYLISQGYDVEIVNFNPGLFVKKEERMNGKDIIGKFEDLYKTSKSEQNKKVLSYFLEFMNKGGKFKAKIPDIADISEEIKNNRPLGALMTTNFIKGNIPKFNFHFNVITGFDDNHIFVNDPLADERGGKQEYLISDFFYGLYACAHPDLDNASLIKIKKLNAPAF